MKTIADVTVAIAHIPVRDMMVKHAEHSAREQTMVPRLILTETDLDRTGSAATRNRALVSADTEWIIWLDDDDLLMPNAVQLLVEAQEHTGADVVSGAAFIPQIPGHAEPIAPDTGWLSAAYVQERSRLHVTSLMRTEAVRAVGGFEYRRDPGTGLDLDDYGLYWNLAAAGATFYRIPETVLIWNHHGANTSGDSRNW